MNIMVMAVTGYRAISDITVVYPEISCLRLKYFHFSCSRWMYTD